MTCYDSSTVGYHNKDVAKYQFVATTFTKVDGGEGYKLGDFKVNCDELGEKEDGWIELVDAIVELDSHGTFKRKIVYCPEWYAEGESYTKGWYDVNDTEDFVTKLDDTVDMPFGYGVQVSMSKARNQQVVYSGAVKPAPTIFDLSAGYWIIGNCAEKNLKLGDLITNCDESGVTEDGWIELVDAVVELDEHGTFSRKLVYCPEWYAEGESYTKGWYDVNDTEDFETKLDDAITFAPGSGFQVSISKNRNQKITIKSALATDVE